MQRIVTNVHECLTSPMTWKLSSSMKEIKSPASTPLSCTKSGWWRASRKQIAKTLKERERTVTDTSELEIYSLMMYQSCAFVSISCSSQGTSSILRRMHYIKLRWLIKHLMHTKNWKPLSVNFGPSLSLYWYVKKRYQTRDTVCNTTYMCKVQTTVMNKVIQPSKQNLWLRRRRWKTFIKEELKFKGFSTWLGLISCNKKH